jgi:hypothetical protein
MDQHIEIFRAKHLGGYRILIEFDDGHLQEVDFGPFLESASHPQIREFLKAEKFIQFRIEYGDLIWGDYELCFPICDLYENHIAPVHTTKLAA